VKDAVKKATAEAYAAAQTAELHIERTAVVRIEDSFNQGNTSRDESRSFFGFGAQGHNRKMESANIPVMPSEQKKLPTDNNFFQGAWATNTTTFKLSLKLAGIKNEQKGWYYSLPSSFPDIVPTRE